NTVTAAAPQSALLVLSNPTDIPSPSEFIKHGAQDCLIPGAIDQQLLLRTIHHAIERKRAQIELQNKLHSLEAEITNAQKNAHTLHESNARLSVALAQFQSPPTQSIDRTDHLHIIQTLTKDIAHDVNNALAPILGFSELLLLQSEDFVDITRIRNYIEMIHSAAKTTARQVSELLETHQLREAVRPHDPQNIHLNHLILQAIAIRHPHPSSNPPENNEHFDLQIAITEVPPIPCNPAEIRELIVLLVFNPPPIPIPRRQVTIKTATKNHRLIISVHTTIPTIPPDPSPLIRQETPRTLRIAEIVRKNGGTLHNQPTLESTESIEVSFPIPSSSTSPISPTIPATAIAATTTTTATMPQLRILIIDDDDLVREVLGVYLAIDQHQITAASSGQDGLTKFFAGEFDVVMTDRAMDGLSGDDVATAIKKSHPHQPIILLTGFGELMKINDNLPPYFDMIV
ncbi:MAG: hybrid sensor histidine kinase/response regulator, partial [Verrucomicrobia bacterium]|nr:hybrid sensor histidine kinase/response regulator [Verrucomicrobiota bacterium]